MKMSPKMITGHIIHQGSLVIRAQICLDCWGALTLHFEILNLQLIWITYRGTEGQLIVKPENVICYIHSFWQTIISSLALNIPIIYPPKFPAAYKSGALRGDRNVLVSFIRPQLSITQRAGKKTATTPSCSPRLWAELNPRIPAMLHSTRLKISHRATLTRTQRESSALHMDYHDQLISGRPNLTTRR